MLYCPSNRTTPVASLAVNRTAELTSLNVFTICLHGLVSAIGIAENLLIVGVVGFRVRRSAISVWILNLAASDLLATGSLPFFTLYMARGDTWTLGTTFCRLHSSVFFLNMFVSGFLLAAVSMDRCLVVLRPVWAQNHRSVTLVRRICVAIWVLAAICTIPFYLFRDTIPLPSGKILCYYNYARFGRRGGDLNALCEQRKQILAVMRLFLAFVIPLIVIVVSYGAVNARLARRGCRRPFRFVRLVVAVVVSFVLCWAPYHLFITIEVVAPSGHAVQALVAKALPVSATVGFLNSVLNPVLYVFSCPDLCSNIRHSLSAVMESVMVEDLAELTRRRSTARSSVGTSEIAFKEKTLTLRTEVESLRDEVVN